MLEEPELQWEKLNSTREDARWYTTNWETFRTCVPGGWLVLTRVEGGHPNGVTFYPDPQHSWNGGSVT